MLFVPAAFAEVPPPLERTIITGCNTSFYDGPPTFALSNDNSIFIPSTQGIICKTSPNGEFTPLDFTNVLEDGYAGAFHLDSNDNLFFAVGGGSADSSYVHKSTLDGLLLLSFQVIDNLGNTQQGVGGCCVNELITDPAGNIYTLHIDGWADAVGFSIFKFNPAGIYVGQITLPPSIHLVSNITFDSLGNFYFVATPSHLHGPDSVKWLDVTDIDSHQLNKMSPDGNVTTLIDSADGSPSADTVVCVKDIEFDSIGNIYLVACPSHTDLSTSKFDSNGVLLFEFESNPKSEYEAIKEIEIGSDGKLYALQTGTNILIFRDKFVEDNVPPTINPVENIIAEATSSSGAIVTFSPTANDALDGSMPVDCTPSSGSTFPLGTIQITCTSTDYSLNTSYLTFEVNVTDSTPPSSNVPSSTTATPTIHASSDTAEFDESTNVEFTVPSQSAPTSLQPQPPSSEPVIQNWGAVLFWIVIIMVVVIVVVRKLKKRKERSTRYQPAVGSGQQQTWQQAPSKPKRIFRKSKQKVQPQAQPDYDVDTNHCLNCGKGFMEKQPDGTKRCSHCSWDPTK